MQLPVGSTHKNGVAWIERQEVYPFFSSISEHIAFATQLFNQFSSLFEVITLVGHQEALQLNATTRANYGVTPLASIKLPLLATLMPSTYPTGSTLSPRCSHRPRTNHWVEPSGR